MDINGQAIYIKGGLCKKITDFENGQIYFVSDLNVNLKTYKKHYKKHYINLIELRKIEIRENKLKRILK